MLKPHKQRQRRKRDKKEHCFLLNLLLFSVVIIAVIRDPQCLHSFFYFYIFGLLSVTFSVTLYDDRADIRGP
jgi:hypothetical protein